MTDSEFTQQKNRVKKYIKKWQKPLGMGWFVAPLDSDLPLQHEYATETLARAIMCLREAGKKDK